MIGDELTRLWTWEDRHRRLAGRLAIVLLATAVVDVFGTIAVYVTENGVRGGEES